jgi:hypothetical protein
MVPDLAEVAGTGQHREHHHRQPGPDPIPDSPGVTRIVDPVEHLDQLAHPGHTRIRWPAWVTRLGGTGHDSMRH